VSEQDVAALGATSLFGGMAGEDLLALARLGRHRELAAGEVLWHQGEPADGMVLLLDGRVAVSQRLPAGRTVELAESGPGETLGELSLIDGGTRSATVRAVEHSGLLALDRADVDALIARHGPVAFALRRRFALMSATRLRAQMADLAASLGPQADNPGAHLDLEPALEPADLPDPAYLRRMARFFGIPEQALQAVVDRGSCVLCPRGGVVVHEGRPPVGFALVLNGAIGVGVLRGTERIRVGLAGPGAAVGLEALVDGGPAPAWAGTRERARLVLVGRDAFDELFGGEDDTSLHFLDLVTRDLASWLRRAMRPQARLAVLPST
jgi:CRP/FNR family transcriptional regulator, cyclic AMP receptor protein